MTPSRHSLSAYRSSVLAVCGVCIGVILVIFADLRETPLFWRNVGGYPIWLREDVLTSFYPLLIFNLVLLASLTLGLLRRLRQVNMLWWAQTAFVLSNWVLTGITLVIILSNNIANLLEGREFHSHSF